MSIGMINRMHRKRSAMVCAMAFMCAALICSFSANSLLALGVPENIISRLQASHHASTWRSGMSVSTYYLSGSNDSGCRVVPYWEDNSISDTVVGASYTEDGSYLGSVGIKLKPDSPLDLSPRSITASTGDRGIVGPYGGASATLHLGQLGVPRNPGECTVTDILSYSCHNHAQKDPLPIYCPSDYDGFTQGLTTDPNCDVTLAKHDDACKCEKAANQKYTNDVEDYNQRVDAHNAEVDLYEQNEKCRKSKTCAVIEGLNPPEPFKEQPPNKKDSKYHCATYKSNPDDCGNWFTCTDTNFGFCLERGYPEHYWFVQVKATRDKEVARPGEPVRYTYTVSLLHEDLEARNTGCGGFNYSTSHPTQTAHIPITVYTNTVGEQRTFTLNPGEWQHSWTVDHIVTQNDVGHDIFGKVWVDQGSWRCVEPYLSRSGPFGRKCTVSDKIDATVHYNWDDQLKSERKVISDKWREPKPYGVAPTVFAYPDDYIMFKHSTNLRYHYDFIKEYGVTYERYLTKTNAPVDFYDHNSMVDNYRGRWVTQWPKGTLPNRPYPPIMEGWINNFNQSRKVIQDDVTKTMCEYISARPGGFTANMIYHNQDGKFDEEHRSRETCVHFPYHYTFEIPPDYGPAPKTCSWYGTCKDNYLPKEQKDSRAGYGVKIQTKRESDDRVLLGDPFKFTATMSFSGGRTKTKPYKFHSYIAVVNGDAVNTNNMEGPLVYPNAQGFNNSAFNCMIGAKNGAHKIAPGNIKKCYELCSGRGDWNGKITCEVDQKDGIAWNDKSGKTIAYDGQFNETLFKQARPKPGDKICYWAAISDWAAIDDISAPSILVSNMVCTDVAKQPQMKIIGGDAIAGKNIVGAVYNKVNPINGNRGSWSQYGLFAHDDISHFGSAGFSNPWYVHHNNSCRLSYANRTGLSSNPCNIDKLGKLGHFGMSSDGVSGYAPKIPDIDESSAKLKPLSGELNLNTIGEGETVGLVYRGVGDLNIYGDLADKARVVVYVPKDRMDPDSPQVNITGDIKPKSKSFDRLSSIPSLTVIADNDINVNAAVSNMFGNYISRGGRISTCKEAKGTETDDTDYKVKPRVISTKLGVEGSMVCNRKPLKVQGTLMSAGDVTFYRTYGSENFDEKTHHDEEVRALASEEVDYTPNTFLLPYYQSYNFEDKTSFIVRTAKNMIPRY